MRSIRRFMIPLATFFTMALITTSALQADDAADKKKAAIVAQKKAAAVAQKKAAAAANQNLTKAEKQALREKMLAAKKAKNAPEPVAPVVAAPLKADNSFEARAVVDTKATTSMIDRYIDAKLAEKKIVPSGRSSDAEFLRRAYLDITGVIPSTEEALGFLDSKDPQKRAKLIEQLLASENYGRHMADIWQSLLVERTSDNRRVKIDPLTSWLDDGFNANKPWNQLVNEIIVANGSQAENGAVTFYLTNLTVDKMTDQVCSLFLGVQLQCAQCHNHPFTDWKQDEYWGMAAFFMKVRQNNNNNKALKDGATPGVDESNKGRPKNLPEATKLLPAKFLGAEQPKLPSNDPHRPVLANWVTDAKNPYFAKAMVNRTWAQLFGRGLVNPVDDMHDANPASHPELMNELASSFIASGFDLKNLFRTICNSEAYQRTSRPEGDNLDDTKYYSHMAMKVLTAEQLYDSLAHVIGSPDEAAKAKKAGNNTPQTARDRFVLFYNVADVPNPTEYEAGIPQALKLMNSAQMTRSPRMVQEFGRHGKTPLKMLETMYLMTMSRRPTEAEVQRLAGYVTQAPVAGDAYGDILWALINSSEFSLNR